MRKVIYHDTNACVGCNRCTRICPLETANVTSVNENGEVKVNIDAGKCIACGACVSACRHGARSYEDDTKTFIDDLRKGMSISLIVAPAMRTNTNEMGRVLTWLRNLGVRKIYDVSLGADICTWAHIRFIQKNNPSSVITQPCPAIVNYCLMYQPKLLQNLSPIHSPMLCTAVYMDKYEKITDRIAAISPCIAKTHEFESTGLVQYNVTFKKLFSYIKENHIRLPEEVSDFDHYPSGLGSVYSMPGGLKENIEFFLGKVLRIDKSEGQTVVYDALDSFLKQPAGNLPAIFDVLNCAEGCNLGTGCSHEKDIFEINTVMEKARKDAAKNRDRAYFEGLYEDYDKMFQLNHFVRSYSPAPINLPPITEADIEDAFVKMDKETDVERRFDCGACGSNTCFDMARKIVLNVNVPENCIRKNRNEIKEKHSALIDIQRKNLENVAQISTDIENIKAYAGEISANIDSVNASIVDYENMAKTIGEITRHINIISINTSIEAARAGAQGRAFSVIAAEIKNLAENSRKAVSRSNEASAVAGDSMQEMNKSMEQILTAVETAHRNIKEISQSQ